MAVSRLVLLVAFLTLAGCASNRVASDANALDDTHLTVSESMGANSPEENIKEGLFLLHQGALGADLRAQRVGDVLRGR